MSEFEGDKRIDIYAIENPASIANNIGECKAIMVMATQYGNTLLAAYALVGWVLFRDDQCGNIIDIHASLRLTALAKEEVNQSSGIPDFTSGRKDFVPRARDALELALGNLRKLRYIEAGTDDKLVQRRWDANQMYHDLQYWMQHIGFETKRVASVTTRLDTETRITRIVRRIKDALLSILGRKIELREVREDDRVRRHIDTMEELELAAVMLSADQERVQRILKRIKERSQRSD